MLVIVAMVVAGLASAVWFARAYEAQQVTEAPLTAYAPEGALLTVESPDFHTLLMAWTGSEEAKRWLTSDQYANFSRSNLFARLADAQKQFATSAGLNPDGSFLAQVAGDRSVLAWYGIGDLRMLYLTHMAPGAAAKTPLYALRSRFEMRQVGSSTYYVRTEGDPARTVAFAVHGDDLLLATDESVLAGSLALLDQTPAGTAQTGTHTVATESWYAAATAAAGRAPGELRMTLNLAKLVPSPYFRSYWVQQNVTEMKQYRAAVTDLDRTGDSFREQRVLLPEDAGAAPVPAADLVADLGSVLAYLPPASGVWRASAQPGTRTVLDQLEDKLLTRGAGDNASARSAPQADLSTPSAGSADDLDERIDTVPAAPVSRAAELAGVAGLLDRVPVKAMLVYQTAASGEAAGEQGVFFPVHTAMVLERDEPWAAAEVEAALLRALAGRLTVGRVGLTWQTRRRGQMEWAELGSLGGVVLAVRGRDLLLASDAKTLFALSDRAAAGKPEVMQASVLAGFAHGTERGPMLRLVHAIEPASANKTTGPGVVPPFFAGDVASLSDSFRALDEETFRAVPLADGTVRQTVVYRWKR